MAEIEFDPFTLGFEAERNNERSAITAGVAGIASGLIKIPEGVVSLGAELVDLGLDTNTAADVEQFFDKINPFEEVAQEKAAGKITEALTQVVSVGTAGFKIATKLADKALKAKKAGNYVSFTNPNLIKATEKASQLNKAAKTKRFAAGVLGGAAGETFVADVEDIGTFGDIFEGGPTELDRDTELQGADDALRKIMNRLKFGSESILLTPFVYGVGLGAKALATRGKELAYSNSQLERFFDKVGSAFRARGAKPQELFESKRTEIGRGMADTNRAMEIVKDIDKNMDKLFPPFKNLFDKSTQKEKNKLLKEVNDAMFAGKLDEPLPINVQDSLISFLRKKGADDDTVNNIFNSIQGARGKFTELIQLSSNAPVDIATLRGLMGQRVGDYLGNTYRIFEDKSVLPFTSYKPTDEAMQNAKKLFMRYSQRNKNPLTELEAEQVVNDLIKTVPKNQVPGELPFFKYLDLTPAAETSLTKKTFQRVVEKDIGDQKISEVIGPGSKIFRELFGEIKDPRYSVYNAMTKLSGVARKNQMFDEMTTLNDDLITKGQRAFFYDSRADAVRALPNQDIVPLDDYLLPFFKGDYAVNPLQGKFTSKDIAEGIGNAQNVTKFLRGERAGATLPEKGIVWGYRNLILFPKALSQIAKTVLSPVTHFRNFFSASAFSGANGVFFENPLIVKNALGKSVKTIQVGTRSKEANELYRELLELGVVNSEVRLGDLKNLMKDTKMADGINFDGALKALMKRMGKIQKGAEDLYTAEDDFWKITNFFVEKDRLARAYAKAGREITERQLKEEAADIVRNTVPNYAYVSDTVRALRALPIGNFMSFPSEILRTGTNIARRSIKEINDPALRAIGMKRLMGMTAVTAVAPYAIQKGFQAMYDVSNEALQALKEIGVPEWSKNSTILPIRDPETGELKYIDYSHGNAYDTLYRPFQTLLNEVQSGITNEEVLMKSFTRGIAQAAGELADPFVSESIFTEAFMDIVSRGGVTKEGARLYTDQTPDGDKAKIIIDHLADALMPFSAPQIKRLYRSALDKADERGQKFELPDELAGLAGFRAIKVDPIRNMGFEISKYQKGERDARREFTGGAEGVLKGGKIEPEQIIRQYFIANKSLFNVKRDMRNKIKAAEILGVDIDDLGVEFRKRQISPKEFGQLNEGIFDPYFPSATIVNRFEEIAEDLGQENSFEEARDVIEEIRDDLLDLNLSEPFNLKLEDYIVPAEEVLSQAPLPDQPMPNPQIVSPQPTVTQTGLTPTEQALLSEEEKVLKLRQRGMV
tara:strand:- start:431 stop:4255 length:3825 start_codon:yes stop_codon:yes gene_type:complete